MSINCYSQRLLNPFRGTINVISYESAEAVTTDGLHWDIYVRNAELADDLDNPAQVQTSEIRYGKWSKKKGLKRGPLYPSEDFKRLEHRGAIVYEHLLKMQDQLPFPFQDHYEYWLFDDNQQPLALLDSAVSEDTLANLPPAYWRAGMACRNSFHCDVHAQDINNQNTSQNSAEYLERYINHCAGESPKAHWVKRGNDGSGVLFSLEESNTRFDASAFPEFFIRNTGHDPKHTQLLEAFFAWQSPWLLLLTNLAKDQRTLLEQQARKRAQDVARNHLLYPAIINDKEIKAALVEAMLRDNSKEESEQEKVMSTWYLELQSTTME